MTADTDALRLVPVEPTPEMISAGAKVIREYEDLPQMTDRSSARDFIARNWVGTIWPAMLAAAPAVQPAAGQSDWSDEDAKRYIADWCPDYVKDYIDRLAALSTPAQASGEIHGEVTDEWAERFCEAVNWSPDGQECKTVEGEFRCVSFRDLAKGYILSAIATNPHGAHPPAQASETGGEVERLRAALEPFSKLARVRYPEEGGAPSWIDLMTNNGECDELELRSHVALDRDRAQLLDAADFRNAEAALSAPQAAPGSQHDDHEDDEAFHPQERDHD